MGAGSEGTWKASGEPVVAPPLALLSGFRWSQAWLDRTHGEGTWEEGEAPPLGRLDLYTQKPQEPQSRWCQSSAVSPSVTRAEQGQGKLMLTSGPHFSFPGTSPSRDDLLWCTACLGLLLMPGPRSHRDSCQRSDSEVAAERPIGSVLWVHG